MSVEMIEFAKKKTLTSVMVNLILTHHIKKFAEIGVLMGQVAKWVLRSVSGSVLDEYWAVDRWMDDTRPEGDWERMYRNVCAYMPWFPNLRVVRMDSVDASSIFRDGYFDMVMIDADHTYEGVAGDIGAWAGKVRKGGILCGHDYYETDNDKRGVKRAVDDIFGVENVTTFHSLVWAVMV